MIDLLQAETVRVALIVGMSGIIVEQIRARAATKKIVQAVAPRSGDEPGIADDVKAVRAELASMSTRTAITEARMADHVADQLRHRRAS